MFGNGLRDWTKEIFITLTHTHGQRDPGFCQSLAAFVV